MRSVTDGEGTGRTDAVQLGARTLPLKARGTISGDETSASSTVGEFGPEGVPTAVRSEDWGTVQVNATPAPGRIRVSALARNRNSVTGGSVGQARPVVGSPPHRPRQSRSAGLILLDWPPIALATGPKARGGCPGFLHAAARRFAGLCKQATRHPRLRSVPEFLLARTATPSCPELLTASIEVNFRRIDSIRRQNGHGIPVRCARAAAEAMPTCMHGSASCTTPVHPAGSGWPVPARLLVRHGDEATPRHLLLCEEFR